MIDDSYRHVLSDEPTEHVYERGDQRFDGRGGLGDQVDAVLLDSVVGKVVGGLK